MKMVCHRKNLFGPDFNMFSRKDIIVLIQYSEKSFFHVKGACATGCLFMNKVFGKRLNILYRLFCI